MSAMIANPSRVSNSQYHKYYCCIDLLAERLNYSYKISNSKTNAIIYVQNYLVDGYPKSLDCALDFEAECCEVQQVLCFEVSNETCEARMLGDATKATAEEKAALAAQV